MRQVQIAGGKSLIELPNGFPYNAGAIVTLSDEQFELLEPSLFPGTLIDLGEVDNPERLGGSNLQTEIIPVSLSAIANAGVFTKTLDYAGTLYNVRFIVIVPATTAAKAATLTGNIAGSNVTGGAVGLTSANATPRGAAIAGSAITAANTFTAGQAVGVKASSVTAFVEGSGIIELVVEPAT